MLAAGLAECRRLGLDRVLLTCAAGNQASRRVILANGGVPGGRAGGEDRNDLGGVPVNPVRNTYAECQAQAGVPGDCGEGIHLMSSSYSTVENNVSTGNSGGILVSDETGPAAHNRIAGNVVADNHFGIWTTGPVTVRGEHDNRFAGDTVPVAQG
jgi:parallel beta-helix repeat protein